MSCTIMIPLPNEIDWFLTYVLDAMMGIHDSNYVWIKSLQLPLIYGLFSASDINHNYNHHCYLKYFDIKQAHKTDYKDRNPIKQSTGGS